MFGRRDLIDVVRERLEGISEEEARRVVEAILEAITVLLERDGRVSVPGFGTFTTVTREARKGRDPASGETIQIPAKVMLGFRVHSDLRTALEETIAEPGVGAVGETVVDLGEWGGELDALDLEGTGGEELAEAPLDPFAEPGAELESPETGPAEVARRRGPSEEREHRYTVVEVCYATDREPTSSEEPAERYGSERGDGSLEYGVCEVSIPEDHRIGRLEGPSWRRLELRPDPEKHVVLLGLETLPEERFHEELSARVRESAAGQILLFLHGFNVTFEDAARRTAQIAYDLSFDGVPAFYSWPSKGKLSLAGYTHDESNVEWTVPHLKGFLQALSRRSGAEAIHLIAHSMGNRALTDALKELAAVLDEPDAPAFSEVILTAPDVDADVFRQLAETVRRTARRVTLYASERDRALAVSERFHGFPRAGDAGEDLVVVPGVDTIDASAVDTDLVGHFYYGDNRSVLSDVFNLLRGGDPPDDRFGLRPRESPLGRYWVFAP